MTSAGQTISAFAQLFLSGQPRDVLFILSARMSDGTRRYKRFPAGSLNQINGWINSLRDDADIYYKTALLKPDAIRMTKESFQSEVLWLWADLDAMDPATLNPPPTVLVESSPNRYQALWRMKEPTDVRLAERLCRAIAYRYNADHSGWDIGQELRVPGTLNHKYDPAPMVTVLQADMSRQYTVEDFQLAGVVPAEEGSVFVDTEAPEITPFEGKVPAFVLEPPTIERGTGKGWSAVIWRSLCGLRDLGWKPEDALRVMWWSPQNKYRADGRPPRDLWRDITKCWDEPRGLLPGQLVPTIDDDDGDDGEWLTIPQLPGLWMVEREATGWPLLVQTSIDAFKPSTLFSDESIAALFLSGYSVLFPNLDVGGLNAALWTMLLSTQGTGKTTVLDNMLEITRKINPALGLVTSGSPEGLTEGLGQAPATLIKFAEYSDMMKQMAKREGYANTMKELFLTLFDGSRLEHKTRRNAISVERSFATIMAATNVVMWRKYGDVEDVSSGYLSRFLVIADDSVSRDMEHEHLQERLGSLYQQMTGRVYGLSQLRRTVHEDPDVLPAYKAELLAASGGLVLSLDVAARQRSDAVPPDRVMQRVQKLAALLELSEANPQVYNYDTLVVRKHNDELAVRLGRLSQAWAQRAISMLAISVDAGSVDAVIEALQSAGKPLRPMDIARRVPGSTIENVHKLIDRMESSGMLVKEGRMAGAMKQIWVRLPDA